MLAPNRTKMLFLQDQTASFSDEVRWQIGCYHLSKQGREVRIRSKDNSSNDVLFYVNFSFRLLIRFVAVTHLLIK